MPDMVLAVNDNTAILSGELHLVCTFSYKGDICIVIYFPDFLVYSILKLIN